MGLELFEEIITVPTDRQIEKILELEKNKRERIKLEKGLRSSQTIIRKFKPGCILVHPLYPIASVKEFRQADNWIINICKESSYIVWNTFLYNYTYYIDSYKEELGIKGPSACLKFALFRKWHSNFSANNWYTMKVDSDTDITYFVEKLSFLPLEEIKDIILKIGKEEIQKEQNYLERVKAEFYNIFSLGT